MRTKLLPLALLLLWSTESNTLAQTPHDSCPPPSTISSRSQPIVSLPVLMIGGDTCKYKNDIGSYGGRCSNRAFEYPGPDVAYELHLNRGNRNVGFELYNFEGDLMIALVEKCDGGESCIINSVDLIGAGRGPERIPVRASSYPPGLYYLYVDSANSSAEGDHCGTYKLDIFGHNPSLDLKLEHFKPPKVAVAGESIAYTLAVMNLASSDPESDLDATAVTVTDQLPPGTEFDADSSSSGCSVPDPRFPRTVTCGIDRSLAPGSEPRKVRVAARIKSDVLDGATIRNQAVVESAEGDRDVANNYTDLKVPVRREVKLSLEIKNPEEGASKEVVAGSAPTSGNLVYEIVVTNVGSSDASDIVVQEELSLVDEGKVLTLPNDLVTARFTADLGTFNQSLWTIDELRQGQEAILTIALGVRSAAPDGAVIQHLASVTGLSETHVGELPAQTTSATVKRKVRLALKTDGPAEVVAGEDPKDGNLVYMVILTNNGPSDALDIEVQEEVTRPEQVVTIVSLAPEDPAQSRFEFTSESAGTWTIDSLPSGQTVTLEVVLAVASAAEPGENVISSLATVTKLRESPVGTLPKTEAKTSVRRETDFWLREKTGSPDPVDAGAELTYTLKVKNLGPSDSTGATVCDTLHEDLKLLSSDDCEMADGTEDCGTGVEPSVTCDVGPLAAGDDEVTVSFQAEVASSSTADEITNAAQVLPNEPQPEGGKTDIGIATTTVRRRADLWLMTKTGAPDPVDAGTELTYTITVKNQGPSDSSGATVCDTLPEDVELVSSTDDCKRADGTEDCGTGIKPSVTCDLGSLVAGDEVTVTFKAGVASSAVPGEIENEATVLPNEPQPEDGKTDTGSAITTVRRNTDLKLDKKDCPDAEAAACPGSTPGSYCCDPVAAGGNVIYTVTVTNGGPSYSSGATVCDTLPVGARFVSSPDTCEGFDVEDIPEENRKEVCEEICADLEEEICREVCTDTCEEGEIRLVRCELEEIKDGEDAHVRFVAMIDASLDQMTTITNEAQVRGKDFEDEEKRDDNSNTEETTVIVAADLALEMIVSLGPEGGGLTYELTVTNRGPSDATGVTLVDTLPDGAIFQPNESSPECMLATENEVTCGPEDFKAGEDRTWIIAVQMDRPPIDENTAVVRVGIQDRVSAKGTAEVLIFSAANDPVVVGRKLDYVVEVTNIHPKEASDATVSVSLPAEVSLVEEDPLCEGQDPMEETVVNYELDGIEPWASEELKIPVCVIGVPDGLLSAKASVELVEAGEVVVQDSATEMTTVLEGPLVLPYFVADGDDPESDLDTIFSVRNTTGGVVDYGSTVFDLVGNQQSEETFELAAHETQTKSLSTDLAAGSLILTSKSDPPDVTGEDFQFEPFQESASGNLLVGVEGAPPGLCRRWDIGFFQDEVFGGGTDFIFFVPENAGNEDPDGKEPVVVVGYVYSPAGKLVQTVEIRTGDRAFVRSSTRKGLDLLAQRGTVEWEFQGDLLGHVAGIFKDESYRVAVPAFCQEPGVVAGEPRLVLSLVPDFKLSLDDSAPVTTLFSVRNGTETGVDVTYEYFGADGQPLLDGGHPVVVTEPLEAHGARIVELGQEDVPADALREGYVNITADDSAAILHGEYFRIDQDRRFALGDVLLDTHPELSPRKLCQRWNASFFHGEAFETDFIFYVQENSGATSVFGQVYKESGEELELMEVAVTGRVFVAPVEVGAKRGSIEWDFGDGREGHISTVVKVAGQPSVELSAVCLDSAE